MKNKLWQFIDNAGSFRSDSAHTIKSLYFPLCNKTLMSSISPDLHGDSKKDQNHFLLEPVSRINLSTSRASRNFWLYINPKKVWSTTGVSKQSETKEKDVVSIEAGLLWHKISRKNKNIGLSAEILSFIPASDDPIEIMQVAVTNISSKPISFTPTAAIPLYARSAENIRDHRQVTSLLHRIQKEKHGISVTPTLLFDEAGHSKNTATYFVYGIDDKGCGPAHIFPTQDEFCGESSDLEMPEAVFTNKPPAKNYPIQGKEAIGALRFKQTILKPRKTKSFSIIMGIANTLSEAKRLFKAFDTQSKIHNSLTETKKFWQGVSSAVTTETSDPVFDNWFKWVSIQPTLRKIFGNSFLPDFDYGKGGRGWRDLWQDALSLLFTDPSDVQSLLINNFSGIRVDGSNATIIGKNPGEFTADRNNISRVWMDHGVWPLLTTLFYIHQTGNTKILLEETAYFRDNQISRSRAIDTSWNPGHGFTLKTADGSSYKGTILEHILVENLVQFFNTGPHNFCRLENADWNDGLDMAYEHGESVAFSAMYAYNLKTICTLIDTLQVKKILIFKELYYLLDTLSTQQIDYSHNIAKQTRLDKYFNAVKNNISGEKIEITALQLTHDLTRKTEWLSEHIKKSEWLKEGFFNGYYDNDKQRVEGTFGNTVRMTLPGQVFPIISGIATDDHIKKIYQSAKKHLQDTRLKGFRLNTDFKQEMHNLGRAFSFVYGDKENGAFFNHMCVMFAYAYYSRGYAHEGFEILNSIYTMAVNTESSRIYPCLPEYFNNEGRGMYSYLTGSASWYILTLLTQVFGVRGEYGDLLIEPKLVKQQFKNKSIAITSSFAGRSLEIIYTNNDKKTYGDYTIGEITINNTPIPTKGAKSHIIIPRKEFLAKTTNTRNTIRINLV